MAIQNTNKSTATTKSARPQEKRLLLTDIGQPHACEPTLAVRAKEGEIHWSWCPTWSWMICLWIGLVVLLVVAVVLMLAAGAGGMVIGLLMLLAIVVFMCLLGNYQYNAGRFQAIALARGKREEARALWANMDESQAFRAKDVFFSTRYGGKRLVVLRDGTVESYGSHKDDLFEELTKENSCNNNDNDNNGGGGDVEEGHNDKEEMVVDDEGFEEVEMTADDDEECGSNAANDRDV